MKLPVVLVSPLIVLSFVLGCSRAEPPSRPTSAPQATMSTAPRAPEEVSTEPVAPARPGTASPAPAAAGAIVAQPIAPAERLVPCRIELEHRFLGADDVTWETHRTPVRRMVRDWARERWEVDWDRAPIAPIPLTVQQARTLLPAPHLEQTATASWIWAEIDDGSFSYFFDDKGRTVRVDWDPNADSAAYVFHYTYECSPPAPRDQWPAYADDDAR
jgi:hypothetical protein